MRTRVYGTTVFEHGHRFATYHGQVRAVVAATSQEKAAIALGLTLHEFRAFGCETGNKFEIENAMRPCNLGRVLLIDRLCRECELRPEKS